MPRDTRESKKTDISMVKNMVKNIELYAEHCCGCGECFSICPVDAIAMKKNEQGFLYPKVNRNKCIECQKCLKSCSFNNSYTKSEQIQESYAVKHTDEYIRMESRSGGIFTALSDEVLKRNGVVYGCILIDNFRAVHIRATSTEERNMMRGSKYIQSEMYLVLPAIKEDLRAGYNVLFCGTACQVNAVRDYCKDIDCSKLLLVDIVCHGVPSPLVWQDYLLFLSGNKKKIDRVDFRDKRNYGWADHQETIWFSDGTKYSGNTFTKLFYSHVILRRDCFTCPYKNLNRVGDITIADCWGISKNNPEFDDNKGISLVILNTELGKRAFDGIEGGRIDSISINVKQFLQPPLQNNWDIPQCYNEFWRYYRRHSFKQVVDKYVNNKQSFIKRVYDRVLNLYNCSKKKLMRIVKGLT